MIDNTKKFNITLRLNLVVLFQINNNRSKRTNNRNRYKRLL